MIWLQGCRLAGGPPPVSVGGTVQDTHRAADTDMIGEQASVRRGTALETETAPDWVSGWQRTHDLSVPQTGMSCVSAQVLPSARQKPEAPKVPVRDRPLAASQGLVPFWCSPALCLGPRRGPPGGAV